MTFNPYGEGRAVYIAYDILAEMTQAGGGSSNPQAQLMLNSLEYTLPAALPVRRNGPAGARLRLENPGITTPVTVTITWPPGSQVLDTAPPASGVSGNASTWSLTLLSGNSVYFNAWALPEYDNDTALVVADIFTVETGNEVLYEQLQAVIESQLPEDVDPLVADLASLRAGSTDKAIQKALKKAEKYLEKALRYYQKDRLDRAIGYLLKSTDALKTVEDSDVIGLRLRIDELLWQWARQQNSGRAQP